MRHATLCLLLLAFAGIISAQDGQTSPLKQPAPANGSGGNIFVGTRAIDNADYLGLVSEYDTARQGFVPTAGGSFWNLTGGNYLEGEFQNRGNANDQQYKVKVDLNRWVQVTSYYVNFLHRIDNDPLADLDAAKGSVVLRHDNFAEGVNYAPGWSQLRTEVKGTVPGATILRWRASHRTMLEHGGMQARTLSKCSNCHVVATTKEIDQRMNEISGGVSLVLNNVQVDYDYTHRQFNERGDAPLNSYDRSLHPSSSLPVFDNRVQYDLRSGLLPYSVVPDGRKTMHTVKARVELPKDSQLRAAYTRSDVRNKYVGLAARTWAWNSSLTIPIKKRWAFLVRAKQLDVDSDDVFVDVVEPTTAGGPSAGLTYTEAYPDFGVADFLRQSVRSRNTFSLKGELAGRLAPRTTLRAGYEFRQIDRPNFEELKSTINRLYGTFSTRHSKSWQARVRYQFEHTIDPFRYDHAALMPVIQPYMSPGNVPFTGTQYFTLYRSRQATLTQYPTLSNRVEPSFTWTPNDKVSATLHYRFSRQTNNQLNFSDWNRTTNTPGMELWFAPLERLNFTAAYTFHNERSNSLLVMPVYDG